MLFRTDDLGRDYPRLLDKVLCTGQVVGSRAGETTEVLDLRLELTNPKRCIVSRKGFSRAFMGEEILQLLAGRYDFERLNAVSSVAASMITPATAYGPRTWQQLEQVAAELRRSPNSRRAVVYVGRSLDLGRADDPETAREMPCTMTWQFHLRGNLLHMTVNMRSNDAVWGLPYDFPSFIAVQTALADDLGTELGRYIHNAGSFHVYAKHYDIETWAEPNVELDVSELLGGSIARTRENAIEKMERR